MIAVAMKQLCLIFALSILPTYLYSQTIGDSVIVYVDNRLELNIAIPDYAELKSSDSVITALEAFLRVLPDVESQLSSSSAELVRFSVGKSLTIEPGDPKLTYLIKDGEASNTGFRDRVIISGEGFSIFMTTADLFMITDLPLIECLEKVIAMLPEKTAMSKSLYYQCIGNEVLELENKHRTNRLDFLELHLGAGAGLIRNNWVADLSFEVGLGLVKKGVVKFNPYLSTNLIFDFDEEGDIDLNMFLNIGYHPHLVKDPKKSIFLGVELGFLIVNQGDLFEGTTFKLGVNWSPLKGVYVGPQLYATDNFNKVFPGIRIGFGL